MNSKYFQLEPNCDKEYINPVLKLKMHDLVYRKLKKIYIYEATRAPLWAPNVSRSIVDIALMVAPTISYLCPDE